MDFDVFNKALGDHVALMMASGAPLFEVDLDKTELWDLYLRAFPPGTNPLYKERTEHDCNCCRSFIKSFGNVVQIRNGKKYSIWGFEAEGPYGAVAAALNDFVLSKPVRDVFVSDTRTFGVAKTRQLLEDGGIITWSHFQVILPKTFPIHNNLPATRATFRDTRNLFKRALDEFSLETLDTVLELIAQDSLYKGSEWRGPLTEFRAELKKYSQELNVGQQELYPWERCLTIGPVVGRIRNHSIGTLLIDLAAGMDLDEAVKRYERVVAPANYKRPKAIFTARMVEEAQKTLEGLGLSQSLGRRHARLDDITVNNILFANRDAKKRVQGTPFEELAAEARGSKKDFGKLEEVALETFLKEILPTTKSVELFFDNAHVGNMVSLLAPTDRAAKSMMKWNNNFSWAYSGNVTDSMKERVKAAGGKVDGVLRFSIQWNEDGETLDDLDAHAQEPQGDHIHFRAFRGDRSHSINCTRMTGNLDVDVIFPRGVAVENITWSDRNKMRSGEYLFWVNCYTKHGGRGGFRAEIEFDGQIHEFEYASSLRPGENIPVARVIKLENGMFQIQPVLDSKSASREVWGLKTNNFVPVTVVMNSPNYWDEQDGIGHRHVFLMLDGAKNPERPNGFFNEFIPEELMKHKRVFEALGGKMRVEDSDDQLSGVGFSTTKRASFVVRIEGAFKRMLKVLV